MKLVKYFYGIFSSVFKFCRSYKSLTSSESWAPHTFWSQKRIRISLAGRERVLILIGRGARACEMDCGGRRRFKSKVTASLACDSRRAQNNGRGERERKMKIEGPALERTGRSQSQPVCRRPSRSRDTRPDMTMTISETTRWSEQFTKVRQAHSVSRGQNAVAFSIFLKILVSHHFCQKSISNKQKN